MCPSPSIHSSTFLATGHHTRTSCLVFCRKPRCHFPFWLPLSYEMKIPGCVLTGAWWTDKMEVLNVLRREGEMDTWNGCVGKWGGEQDWKAFVHFVSIYQFWGKENRVFFCVRKVLIFFFWFNSWEKDCLIHSRPIDIYLLWVHLIDSTVDKREGIGDGACLMLIFLKRIKDKETTIAVYSCV